MLRCAASLVIAAYEKIRLIPQDLRALPLELLKKSFTIKVCHCEKFYSLSLEGRGVG